MEIIKADFTKRGKEIYWMLKEHRQEYRKYMPMLRFKKTQFLLLVLTGKSVTIKRQ